MSEGQFALKIHIYSDHHFKQLQLIYFLNLFHTSESHKTYVGLLEWWTLWKGWVKQIAQNRTNISTAEAYTECISPPLQYSTAYIPRPLLSS